MPSTCPFGKPQRHQHLQGSDGAVQLNHLLTAWDVQTKKQLGLQRSLMILARNFIFGWSNLWIWVQWLIIVCMCKSPAQLITDSAQASVNSCLQTANIIDKVAECHKDKTCSWTCSGSGIPMLLLTISCVNHAINHSRLAGGRPNPWWLSSLECSICSCTVEPKKLRTQRCPNTQLAAS